jgi:hypothetical protein
MKAPKSVDLNIGPNDQVRNDNLMATVQTDAMSQLGMAQIKLPIGTCLVPAEAKTDNEVLAAELLARQLQAQGAIPMGSVIDTSIVQGNPSSSHPMTITIQYKIYPESTSGPKTIKRDVTDLLPQAHSERPEKVILQPSLSIPPISSGTPVPPSVITPTGTPTSLLTETIETAQLHKQDQGDSSSGPDVTKETRTVITPSGAKFDVPVIVTGGFDLDALVSQKRSSQTFP